MKPCRTCKFALPAAGDPNSAWCHRAPPKLLEAEGQLSSAYPIVGMNNPGCGEHRLAWWRWFLRRDQMTAPPASPTV